MIIEQHLDNFIQRIQMCDEPAMEALFDATVNKVYGLAVKILSCPNLAEEVVDDVYLQVWRQAKQYDNNRCSALGWILMLCRSRALDRLRKESKIRASEQPYSELCSITSTSVTPIAKIIDNEVSEDVRNALTLLTQAQRQCISLAFYRGMSHSEISQYTGEALGTVKSNIKRGQDILRNILSPDHLISSEIYGEA